MEQMNYDHLVSIKIKKRGIKVKVKAISVAMISALMVTACTSPSSTSTTVPPSPQVGQQSQQAMPGEDPAYAKYAEPVTVKIGWAIPNENGKLADGETNDNNIVSRYLEKITNIKVVHAWEAKFGEGFQQKVNLSIASNDIPDAVVVDRNQLRELVENNMLEDLSAVYNQYGSKLVKDIYDSTNGLALKDATFNGKLYALPNVAIEADAPTLLWIRKDWLDKVKLDAPKTVDDIAKVAKAFIEQDPDGNGKADTIGLPGDKAVNFGGKTQLNGYDALFNSFHAFPKNWIKGADGKVVYGSITPENKAALTMLAEWYKNGLIDKEFALRKETKETIVANKAGMFFGPWWAPYVPLPDAMKNDPKADWKLYAAPLDADGKFSTHMAPVTDRYLVVKKGFKNPEAIVKLLNAFTRLERLQDPNKEDVVKLQEYEKTHNVDPRSYYPFDLLLDFSDALKRSYDMLIKVDKGEVKREDLNQSMQANLDAVLTEKENPKKDLTAWARANAIMQGGAVTSQPMNKVYSLFYGLTPTMESKWATLEKLENETFLRIIMGNQPISAFDDFVVKWKELGGDQITKEIEGIVNAK
jgi:putative aldouronate transport system substrate-binding protein